MAFRGKPADADTEEMIREIGGEMRARSRRNAYIKRYDIKVLENAVELDDWRIESIKLSRHLRGCKAAYLFAVTLGLQADMMIRRLSALNMARGTVAHSVANALIEDYCDEMQAQIAEKEAATGLFLKPLLFAGVRRLCAPKAKKRSLRGWNVQSSIGLTLTDTMLMVPFKSVTAVIA